MNLKFSVFDIETAPLPDVDLERVKPMFEAPANYKDPAKIEASIKDQEGAWRDKAALDACTGKVLAIGVLDGGIFDVFSNDADEKDILARFWMWLDTMQLSLSHTVVGFCIFNFDLPFLVRRSWINGVAVPAIATRNNRYQPWHENIVDIADKWQCGNRDHRIGLDTLAKTLGVGAKNGEGKDFAALWASDRAKALDYLRNDLELTKKCFDRMSYA